MGGGKGLGGGVDFSAIESAALGMRVGSFETA